MEKGINLFVEWKKGNLTGSKIYLFRIYFINSFGVEATCLKLGFTSKAILQRIISILGAMRKSGLTITNYELTGLCCTPNYSQIEQALLHKVEHHYFYNQAGDRLCFKGSTEILKDTTDNIDLLQIPYFITSNANQVRTYHPRISLRRSSKYVNDTI